LNLCVPESGSEAQKERDLKLNKIDSEDDNKVPYGDAGGKGVDVEDADMIGVGFPEFGLIDIFAKQSVDSLKTRIGYFLDADLVVQFEIIMPLLLVRHLYLFIYIYMYNLFCHDPDIIYIIWNTT
jgi:hypothetical protein